MEFTERKIMNNSNKSVAVAGAGGFIGGHLVAKLIEQGFSTIRAIDIKGLDEWYQVHPDVDNGVLDLKSLSNARELKDGLIERSRMAAIKGKEVLKKGELLEIITNYSPDASLI